MASQISIGDDVCEFGQISSAMNPNCTTGNLSVSLQSPQPFEIKDDDVPQRMVALDVSETDVLVNAFDSISITEALSCKMDDKSKDTVKTDNASESECPVNVCIAPRRRSGRNIKLSQNLATVPATSGRRIATKKASIDLSSLQITRKRRSYFSKQARSSVWGLLENMVQSFEHNIRLEITSGEQKNIRTATKGSRQNEKHGENQTDRKSRKSKGKRFIPTGPISLKVKFGHRCLKDVIPLIDNDTNKNCTTGEELKKLPKIASKVDDRLGEELLDMQLHGCNGNLDNDYFSLSDRCQPGKSAVQDTGAMTLVCHDESLSQEGGSIGNRFSDPGTSPDSEVINLIPDTPVNVPDNLHDLTLSKPCAAPGDAPILMHEKISKRSESMSNAQVFWNLMQGEKQRDGSCCCDTSVLTTAGNGTGNMFSNEIFSGELLHCSGVSGLGISCVSSKLESDLEGNHCSSLGTESPESGLSEKLVSSPDERKVSKEGRPKVSGKSRSEVPKPSKRRGCKKKENKEKEDILHEVKHKSDLAKGLCEVRQHPGTENGTPSGLGQIGSEKKILGGGISSLDILPTEVGERLLPPRNAWVQCDDCHKWRRIPSFLADQIEETNCRWTCMDNLDKAFAGCSFPQEKSNSEINAELEISDEEDVSRVHLSSNGSGQKNPLVAHQSSWSRIKSNMFLHRNRKNQTVDEIMVCHCKPPSDGRMGCGDGCLNRMLNIECAKGTCPCGEFCSNQQFQKRSYAKLKCFKYGKKGYGLQLLEDVYEGQFLIEYVGEVLDMHAYEARQKEYALKGHKHFYFMTLNGSEVIDACAKGNLGRFINHSCDPNCRTEKWMVNGEVCIGLFALRDIKQGEEVTFDYNYVRVFGAAVKKCVCGSPHCRGYIGGDPLNAEVIVQDDSDDEYPEPVMLHGDADMNHKQDNSICATSAINVAEIKIQGKPPKNKNTVDETFAGNQDTSHQRHMNSVVGLENVNLGNPVAVVSLNAREESVNFPDGSPASSLNAETSVALEASECMSHSSVQPVETSLSLKDTCETMSGVTKECSVAGEVSKNSFSTTQEFEVTSLDAVVSKSLRKSKSSNGRETHDPLKPCPFVKTSRESPLVKKVKQRNNAVNSRPLPDVDMLQVSQPKFKKPPDGSLHGHFEAVEEKLNELLDHNGGISKRKDASRCYLKLLLLTAASGDGCNGEAIQSNRELSMILDAILKTKSRTVLMDIMNKNGLQMLHNIMKRYRREFNKIPILRKLLKVLEYLAVRDILSPEHINGDTSRAGVESFRDSILGLTEHKDKQVHQIARNFRDKWLRRPLRNRSCIDRDDSRINMHSGSPYNRCLASQNQWCDLGGKPSEAAQNTCHPTVSSVQADACVPDGSSASCSDIGAASRPRKRKHKSRWDQEAEEKPDPRNESNVADDKRQVLDDDAPPGYEFPPGFLFPVEACMVLSDSCSAAICSPEERRCREHPLPVVTGNLQQRFISRLPVSYGIPFSEVQQFGSPQKGRFDAWTVAPGIPFQPFPPLPPYPRDRRESVPSASNPGAISELPQITGQDCHTSSPGHLAQNPPSVSGADQPQDGTGYQLGSKRDSDSCNSGRRYFRKQKYNNSKLAPPWLRIRSGWEYTGNNSSNNMCIAGVASREDEFRSIHSWMEHNLGMQDMGHTLRQHTSHRY
ncbi:PREDICTED: histone-lysine N-methyltransferase ASHH2-like [Nicotiana attenuata]|uniref:Histone-lysine n-methyltransferase ashh2 n=1 Tax=Nicotiana attenuata TaxID=49451 RepID=A0A314LI39_NICAT|nr:PREDICTED: histone-lysine N-methyltransferase ASHH2-like [Nicotiana attenuata]XP_019258177.1 PREDICTED: histone-lysine N-methyltransferase ASHH2-like [Nicotiana attenuata]XP_019258178.1 PREDICTED: histone-lysine N-methyltransferase ASHH2-like [Nicotiana attenuata]OIT40689.1 histone-lysine n-methyltransferase ashh2 [Nicotiana attenuata]